jgi:hypothetical protein
MTEWQRITWVFFHTLTLNYNDQYRDKYIEFFDTFKTIIPCKICRNHFNQNISKDNMSIDTNINSDRIFNWTVDLHNSVNKMHHKKIWNYDEARNYYTQNNFNNNILKYIVFEYIRSNFKKGMGKTEKLLIMMRSLPYLHPDENIRNRLIDFKEKFELNRDTIKNWLLAFVLIIKGT